MGVEIYTVRKDIGGVWHEDLVTARSRKEAEVAAKKLGGVVAGKLLEETPISDSELFEIFRLGSDYGEGISGYESL
jgi:hypothetical protein